MNLSAFDFQLPPELIAQSPPARREDARLLVHDLGAARTTHGTIASLLDVLNAGDLLVVNDTRVLPARLFGRRATGGRVEVLLLRELAPWRWTAFVNPARKARPGDEIELANGGARLRFVERLLLDDGTPDMEWVVELVPEDGEDDPLALLERFGETPLPPYIRRDPAPAADASPQRAEDRSRYQTVYAARPGAAAAPTAGLHFTRELLDELARRGVERATVTLHVGRGTFQPIQVDEIERHEMHAEWYELTPEVARAIDAARERGGRVVAVGTTSVRVLESCADEARLGRVLSSTGETRLFLRPGSAFRVVDALLTNFHLPRSSLLVLVSAFAGRERALALYEDAVRERYRFFSYGDAMFLHGRALG